MESLDEEEDNKSEEIAGRPVLDAAGQGLRHGEEDGLRGGPPEDRFHERRLDEVRTISQLRQGRPEVPGEELPEPTAMA